MVPSTFTQDEIEKTRKFLKLKIAANSRFVNGKVLGNPYTFYKEIATFLGYDIECESDGDRLGIIAGAVSELEFSETKLLLTATVISKEYMRPGPGFYTLADAKGLFQLNGKPDPDGLNELTFWNDHVKKIVEKYGKK